MRRMKQRWLAVIAALSVLFGGVWIANALTGSSESFELYGITRRTGVFDRTPKMTLTRAITAAGGYSTYGGRERIYIIRGDELLRFVSMEILNGKAQDPEIKDKDIIVVPRQ